MLGKRLKAAIDSYWAKLLGETDFSAPLRGRDSLTMKGWLKLASRWGVWRTVFLYRLLYRGSRRSIFHPELVWRHEHGIHHDLHNYLFYWLYYHILSADQRLNSPSILIHVRIVGGGKSFYPPVRVCPKNVLVKPRTSS